MPRLDRNRSLVIPYRPNPPPAPGTDLPQVTRAAWEEFARLATSLSDVERPVCISVSAVDSVSVAAAATYSRMFDNSPTIELEKPGGAFVTTSGIWTCPQEGIYQVTVNSEFSPLNAPAAKSYAAFVRLTHTHADGAPDTVRIYTGGGLDDQYVSVIGTRLQVLQQGDTLRWDGAATHPTTAGTVQVSSVFYAIRQAGIGDAD